LPPDLEAVHAAYVTALTAASVLDADTHRAYASRVRSYLAWLATTDADGGRLSARGAHDIINAIADAAHLQDGFTSHVLRHTFGTTLVRQGHDLVLVAELLGHARLETVHAYSLPTDTHRQNAINTLLTDR
jgi:integrase